MSEGKVLPCEPYVALQDLRQETIENCPACRMDPCVCDDSDAGVDASAEGTYPSPPPSNASASDTSRRTTTVAPASVSYAEAEVKAPPSPEIPAYLLPPDLPIPTDLSHLSYSAKYACQRASPLTCPNQALAVELDVIKQSRNLEGEERSSLSYARAISVIKGEN